jgi:hypothetical protein
MCSPLGVWLLLAACLTAATGAERAELELAVGCSSGEARALLHAFLALPRSALKAAIAVCVQAEDASDALASWVKVLPAAT